MSFLSNTLQKWRPVGDRHGVVGDKGEREEIDGDGDDGKGEAKFFFSEDVGKGNIEERYDGERIAHDVAV